MQQRELARRWNDQLPLYSSPHQIDRRAELSTISKVAMYNKLALNCRQKDEIEIAASLRSPPCGSNTCCINPLHPHIITL